MEMLVFILYCVLSYWAVGQTIYANKIQIGSLKDIFLTRFVHWCAAGIDFDSSGDSEKAVHPLRLEEKP